MTILSLVFLLFSNIFSPMLVHAVTEEKIVSDSSVLDQATQLATTGESTPIVTEETTTTTETPKKTAESTTASLNQSKALTDPAVYAATFGTVTYDGVDLSNSNELAYDLNEVQTTPKSLVIDAYFDGGPTTTNRLLTIRLNNGLGIETAPGMVADNEKKDKWSFSAATLPTQLQGVIINAIYTPDGPVDGYTPKSGTLTYEVSSGTTEITLSMLTIFDIGFGANAGTRNFKDLLEITATATISGVSTKLLDEKIESYTITGKMQPLFYNGGAGGTIKAGDSIVINFSFTGDGTNYANSIRGAAYKEFVQTFRFNKKLGLSTIDSPDKSLDASQFEYTIDHETDPDNDIVTLTVRNFYANFQKIAFHFNTTSDIEPGRYEIKAENPSATPILYSEALAIGKSHSQIITIPEPSQNKLKLNNSSGTIVTSADVLAAENYPLGVYRISNIYADAVTEQKIKLTFADDTIGVTSVQLVTGRNQGAKNVVITTNKGKYEVEAVAWTKNMMSLGVALLSLKDYSTDPDEFIQEITYESTDFPGGSGNGSVTFLEWENSPGSFYGKILKPSNKSYQMSIATVPKEKSWDDEEVSQSQTTMTISNANNISFRDNNLTLPKLAYTAGTKFTMSASINLNTMMTMAFVKKGFDFYLREGEYLSINVATIKAVQGDEEYSVANGKIKSIVSEDNEGHKVIKFTLDDVALGIKSINTHYPEIKLSYDVKIKNNAPTVTIGAKDLLAVAPSDGSPVTSVNNTSYFNNENVFNVDGSGDIKKLVGTLHKDTQLIINEEVDFYVQTAVSLNDGEWVSYDYDSNERVIDLNPEGKTKYQLSVLNNSGNEINGYTALVPIPKAGEQTILTPDTPDEFVSTDHLQKEAFTWTASLLEKIQLQGTLNYQVLYATSYEIDKDSPNFKTWEEIQNKDDIRMVKITTQDKIPVDFSESIDFPLALTDPEAERHAGKTNIYSARIYREFVGTAGYKTSEPVAIRLQTGVISGQVFQDDNRNGQKDAEEVGRNGVTVLAYETGSDKTEPLATTLTKTVNGIDGCYEFLGLSKDEKVDIVFVNPVTDDSLRFSSSDDASPTVDSDQLKAQITGITPSSEGFDKINAGLMTPVKINFDSGKGSISGESSAALYPGEKLAEAPKAIQTGYSFKGWYTQKEGGDKVTFPYTVGINDTTFYAHYEENAYNVIYHVEDQTSEVSTLYNSLLEKPANPSKTGQVFLGWYTEPTGGTKWNFNVDIMPAQDLNLYAHFGIGLFEVTFNVDGDTTVQAVEYNTLLEKPADPIKKGYTFDGWYDAAADGTKWDFATDKMPDQAISLYAYFKINQYAVNYVVGEEIVSSVQADYNSLLSVPTDPIRDGYVFDGWYDENDQKWDFEKNKVSDKETTLIAKFTKKEYDLTFDNEGSKTTQKVLFDELASEPAAPNKLGYTFTGWFDEETETQWDFALNKMPSKNKTLTAHYSINQYTVTFDVQKELTTRMVNYNELVAKPADPQANAGYTFTGWKAKNSDVFWNFEQDRVPAEDVTLIAQFQAEDQMLTLDFNGGTSEGPAQITVPTDNAVNIDALTIPEKPGYQFVGWFDGEQQVSGTITMPVGGLTLQAQWEETDQVVRFDANGGTGVTSILAKTNASINLDDQVTTRLGYAFVGWFDQADQQVSGLYTVEPGGAVFTAKWEAEDQTITFELNGGSLDTQPEAIVQPTDTKVDLAAVRKPKRAGYTFTGWFDASGKQFSGTIDMPAGGLILTAQWEKEPVVVKPNDSNSKTDNLTTTVGKTSTKTESKTETSEQDQSVMPKTGEKKNPLTSLTGMMLLAVAFVMAQVKRQKQRKTK